MDNKIRQRAQKYALMYKGFNTEMIRMHKMDSFEDGAMSQKDIDIKVVTQRLEEYGCRQTFIDAIRKAMEDEIYD